MPYYTGIPIPSILYYAGTPTTAMPYYTGIPIPAILYHTGLPTPVVRKSFKTQFFQLGSCFCSYRPTSKRGQHCLHSFNTVHR